MEFNRLTSQTTNWTVEVTIDEHRQRTRARARLRRRGKQLNGLGIARLNPSDRNIAQIGDESDAAHALSNLADKCGRHGVWHSYRHLRSRCARASDIVAVTSTPKKQPRSSTELSFKS